MTEVVTTLEILKKARQLLEIGWCRSWYARDRKDDPVGVLSDKACQWCASGAMWRAAGLQPGKHFSFGEDAQFKEVKEAHNKVYFELPPGSHISSWNDSSYTTHSKVLEIFDCAIKRLETSKKAVSI